MWILSSSLDVRLIMHALLHLPQIIPLLLVVKFRGRRKSFVFLSPSVSGVSYLFKGPPDKGLRSRDFHRPFDDEDLFFDWLSKWYSFESKYCFFVVVNLSDFGQNGEMIVIRCLFLVTNFSIQYSIARLPEHLL